MATDYIKLAEEVKKKGYKRNLSSREIQGVKAKSAALRNKKEKKHENNLFESAEQTIRRIKTGSRYN